MEALSSTLRTTWTDSLQKISCPVLGQIGFRLVRIQTNSLFPQRCLLWYENYQASKKVQADLPAERAHKLNYIVLNNLALTGKSNKPEPTNREELFELEEDWYWRDGLKKRAYKYYIDPDDEDEEYGEYGECEEYEEYEESEEDDEDDLAEDETRAEDLPRGLTRERPETMDLATDHKK